MTLRQLTAAAALALLAIPPVVHAQGQISASEEERLEALARANAEIYTPKTSVTVGVRLLGSGAKTHFGNLGTVPMDLQSGLPAAASAGAVARGYHNGYVDVDTPRLNEVDANGAQTSTPGGRYTHVTTTDVKDADGNVTGTTSVTDGDFVSYTPGMTRNWSYTGPSQATVKPGYIAMSTYSSTSDGGFKDNKQKSSGGVELQASHVMGRLSKRTEWSLLTGISLNSINNKANGDVAATLHTLTDYYSLNGRPAPALPTATDPTTGVVTTTAYVGSSAFTNYTASDGTTVANGFETGTAVASIPNSSLITDTVGGTTVHGVWQVKGAYFLIKLGPSIRTQLTERFGVNASLGIAGAYAGTRYTADEAFNIPEGGGTVAASEATTASKFLGGFYADLNMEWAANERTGLFGGLTAQKVGAYEQMVGSRTAHIDIGTTVGIRGGVTIKF